MKLTQKQVSLYMSDKAHNSAIKDADKAGMSFSQYVNELIEKVRIEKDFKLITKNK